MVYRQVKTTVRSRILGHAVADKLLYCHEALHLKEKLLKKLQRAAYEQKVEKWDTDSESDKSDDEKDLIHQPEAAAGLLASVPAAVGLWGDGDAEGCGGVGDIRSAACTRTRNTRVFTCIHFGVRKSTEYTYSGAYPRVFVI